MGCRTLDALTPTQRRMLDLLSDGLPHSREELHALLRDELGAASNVRPHLSRLRAWLRPGGRDVLCCLVHRRVRYRLVRVVRGEGTA